MNLHRERVLFHGVCRVQGTLLTETSAEVEKASGSKWPTVTSTVRRCHLEAQLLYYSCSIKSHKSMKGGGQRWWMVLTKRNAENWPFQSFQYEDILSPRKSDAFPAVAVRETARQTRVFSMYSGCIQAVSFCSYQLCDALSLLRTCYYCNRFHTHTRSWWLSSLHFLPSLLKPSSPTLPPPHPPSPVWRSCTMSRMNPF